MSNAKPFQGRLGFDANNNKIINVAAPTALGDGVNLEYFNAHASTNEFKQDGAGAVSRIITDKIKATVSVDDFGATGDGITNDTIKLQNAIQSITSGSLELRRGATYLIDAGGLLLANKIGMVIEGNGATIKFTSTATQTTPGFNTPTGIKLLGCVGSSIKNLIVDVNGKGHAAIGMSNCGNCVIEYNTLRNSTGGSALLVASGGNHNTYRKNEIYGTTVGAGRGMWLGNNNVGFDERYAIVEENHVHDCNATGIVLTGSGSRAVLNHCHHNQGSGIIWSGSGGVTGTSAREVVIAGNNCHDNLFHGIQQDGSDTLGIMIYGNSCSNNVDSGIFLAVCSGVTVSGNTCFDNLLSGIAIDTTDHFSVSGNLCFDTRVGAARTQQRGIYLNAQGTADASRNTSDGSITGNICYNNTFSGIHLNTVGIHTISNMTISGNNCAGNTTYGIGLIEASALKMTAISLTGNNCANNGTDIRATIVDMTATDNIYTSQNGYSEFALTNNSTTPNVNGRKFWLASNSSPTAITNLVGGKYGQEITIWATNGNTTINHVAGIIINPAGVNLVVPTNGWVKYIQREGVGRWFLLDKNF